MSETPFRRLLIDAYNACSVGGAELSDLVERLPRSRWAGIEAWVVCDGVPKPGEPFSSGAVSVRHTGAGDDADSYIEREIEADSTPKRLLVVSSDRRVQAAARRRRAAVMPSDRFVAALMTDGSIESSNAGLGDSGEGEAPEVSSGEAKAWMAAFGVEPGEGPKASKDPIKRPPPPKARDEAAEKAADELDMGNWLDGVEPLDPGS